MTKIELIKAIQGRTGQEFADVQAVVNAFADTIRNAVSAGEIVEIRTFGCFKPATRKARLARNIKRNEVLSVPAKRLPVFKPSEFFKAQVNEAMLNKLEQQ